MTVQDDAPAAEQEVALLALLAMAVSLDPSPSVPESLARTLGHLSAGELVGGIAGIALSVLQFRGHVGKPNHDPDLLLQTAWEMFSGWPRAFEDFLSEVCKRFDDSTDFGPTFKGLHHRLTRTSGRKATPEAVRNLVGPVFFRVIEREWTGKPARRVSGTQTWDPKWISASKGLRALSLKWAQVQAVKARVKSKTVRIRGKTFLFFRSRGARTPSRRTGAATATGHYWRLTRQSRSATRRSGWPCGDRSRNT